MTIPSWVKPGFWGVVVGALGWWAVLFWGFGWMSAGAAQQLAANQTQTAVVAAAAPYCVQRFEQQPNAVTAWQALKKSANNYDEADFIQKGKWVVLAGQSPDSDLAAAVANACATQLLALKQLNGVTLSSLK
jgi:hypothetical protein